MANSPKSVLIEKLGRVFFDEENAPDVVKAIQKAEADRLARASEQGYNINEPVYHGTSTDFDAFDPDRAIGTQFWSTTDKAAIESGEVGAQGKGVIKEMYHRIQNPAGWEEYDKFGIDELIARGYDGLALPEADGTITYTAFNPNQYREVKAAFDPALKDSSNLLATGLTAGVGLGALGASDESEAGVVGRLFKTAANSKFTFIDSPDGKLFKVKEGEAPVDITGTIGEEKIRKKMKEVDLAGGLDAYENQSSLRASANRQRIDDARAEASGQADSYKMQHQAPRLSEEGTVSGDNLGEIFPDIYTHGKQYYGEGRDFDDKAISVINKMKGNPDADITMYRAVPDSVDEINEGDWVTTTKEYALEHAKGEDGWKVLSKKIKAKDLANDGNSIHEFGYRGSATPSLLAGLGVGTGVGLGGATYLQRMKESPSDVATRLLSENQRNPDTITAEEAPILQWIAENMVDPVANTQVFGDIPLAEGYSNWLKNYGRPMGKDAKEQEIIDVMSDIALLPALYNAFSDLGGTQQGIEGREMSISKIPDSGSFSGAIPQFLDRVDNPSRYPYIANDDGSTSSHRMAVEVDEKGDWYVFPTIVQMPDGNLKQFDNPFEALRYNKSIGNTIEFGKNKDDAIRYGSGGYKTDSLLNYKPIDSI